MYRSIVNAGRYDLAEKFFTKGYIQHNPNVASGRDQLVEYIRKTRPVRPIPATIGFPVISIMAEGDMVLVASVEYAEDKENPGTKYATTHFDLYRVESGLIAEHWGQPAEEQGRTPPPTPTSPTNPEAMKRLILFCMGTFALAASVAQAADPIVTDSRLITEERRLQILEAKLASLQREVNLIEDRKAVERLQQLWGALRQRGHGGRSCRTVFGQPRGQHRVCAAGCLPGQGRESRPFSRPAVQDCNPASCAKPR